MKTCDPHGQTWIGPKSRKSLPVTCGRERVTFLCFILGRVGRRRETVTCRLPTDCAREGRPVCFCSLTLASIHRHLPSMCLATRQHWYDSLMEELIEKQCNKCLLVLSIHKFHSNSAYADGKSATCKSCHNANTRATYDPVKKKSYHLKYLYGITLEEYNEKLERCLLYTSDAADE